MDSEKRDLSTKNSFAYFVQKFGNKDNNGKGYLYCGQKLPEIYTTNTKQDPTTPDPKKLKESEYVDLDQFIKK